MRIALMMSFLKNLEKPTCFRFVLISIFSPTSLNFRIMSFLVEIVKRMFWDKNVILSHHKLVLLQLRHSRPPLTWPSGIKPLSMIFRFGLMNMNHEADSKCLTVRVLVYHFGVEICVKSQQSGRGYGTYHKTWTKSSRKIKLRRERGAKCRQLRVSMQILEQV